MKRLIPLIILLVGVTVLAQQSLTSSSQPATRTALATIPTTSRSTVAATSYSSRSSYSPDSYRSDYRSRRYGSDTRPSSGSQALNIPPPKPLSTDYAILTQRSMFVKGTFRYADPNRHYTATTNYSTSRTYYPDPPEGNWVLNGIVKQDNEFVAFMENYANGTRSELKSGDAVATGKIGPMTLDYLDYTSGGKTTRVQIGKTLAGGDPPASRPYAVGSTVAPDSSSATSSTSNGLSTAGSADSAATASIIEKLKKRREAENAGK